jgi:hypothetical protein
MKKATIFFIALLIQGAFMHPSLTLDNTQIVNVTGEDGVDTWWTDSYSVGDACYCSSKFDSNIGSVLVTTPYGTKTVKEACDIIGPGPGIDGRPVYNDIQCGNGPPNNRGDEVTCPGRTDYGKDGCKYIGPKWKFNVPVPVPVSPPTTAPVYIPPLMLDNTQILNVPGERGVNKWWIDSYSVGDRCYCSSKFDSNIGSVLVMTPYGTKTVKEACDIIGPGPGIDGRPVYNDIQCGNGPPNNRGDEVTCPGRTDYGQEGCKYIGPKWKFDVSVPVPVPKPKPRYKPTRPIKPKPKPKPRPKPRAMPRVY